MNTAIMRDSHWKRIFRTGMFAAGSAVVFRCAYAQPQVTRAGSENAGVQKTHTLFMGADFDVQQNHKFWRVKGVAGSAFIINKNNEKIFVPTDDGALGMRVYSELKLAASSATVSGYKFERSYTHETDPRT